MCNFTTSYPLLSPKTWGIEIEELGTWNLEAEDRQPENREPRMMNLPQELTNLILGYLNQSSLIQITRVSRTLRRLALESPLILVANKKTKPVFVKQFVNTKFAIPATHHKGAANHILLNHPDRVYSIVSYDGYGDALNNLINLEILTKEYDLEDDLTCLTKLRIMNIGGDIKLAYMPKSVIILKCFKVKDFSSISDYTKLRVLEITAKKSQKGLGELIKLMPSLDRFAVTFRSKRFTDEDTFPYIGATEVTVIQTQITGVFLGRFENLGSLILRHCLSFQGKNLKKFSGYNLRLESVKVEDENISHMKDLKSLVVSNVNISGPPPLSKSTFKNLCR